jgi:hypothetical protein
MRMRIRIWDPGILLTLDPGWKKFGINILDPQHWYFMGWRERSPFYDAAVAESTVMWQHPSKADKEAQLFPTSLAV